MKIKDYTKMIYLSSFGYFTTIAVKQGSLIHYKNSYDLRDSLAMSTIFCISKQVK